MDGNKNNRKGNNKNTTALTTNKAGQVFYKNLKVFFKDGKITDESGKLLSTGGTVKFQNGRLEYVGGTVVQAAAKVKTSRTPVTAPAITPVTAPSEAPVTAPAKKTPVTAKAKKTPVTAKAKKTPITAPPKTPITVPAKSPVNEPAKPAKTPITAPGATNKKVISLNKATVKSQFGGLQLNNGITNRLGPAVNDAGVASRLGPAVNDKRKAEAQSAEPAKRVKEMKVVPQMKDLVIQNILNISPNRNSIDMVCVIPGESHKALIKLEKGPFGSSVDELQSFLKSSSQEVSWKSDNMAKVKLSNTGTFDNLSTMSAEIIFPATNSRINKLKNSCPPRILRETPEFYIDRVMPYIRQWLPANEPQQWNWIDEILNGNVAQNRLVDVHNPEGRPQHGFTLVKDVKWNDESKLDDMHILGIVRRKDIFCLRDLTADDLPLLTGLYRVGTSIIQSRFGIPVEDQLVFIQYYPSTYHLHVHYTTWGKYQELCRLGEAHLLVDVISNLEVDPRYYRKVTLNVFVDKNHQFLYNSQEGTSVGKSGPSLAMPSQPMRGNGYDNMGMHHNGTNHSQQAFRDPTDPFYRTQEALLDLLNRFQEVLHGNLEFLRLPIKELMKHILIQPRENLNRAQVPLTELLHHLQNRPLDHMAQVEGVMAELLQFFLKFQMKELVDPAQNQTVPLQSNRDYLVGYQTPRYR
ncbi:unnamed protein product [Meganyctiphanes norvegica]|uniref:m7GpppX diphosphatase n=1 Tax=Meganyctiphanes norvegica TaxID=48144 RepID=A0AAV2Q5D4_MEGNR